MTRDARPPRGSDASELDLAPFILATRRELDRAAGRQHEEGIPPPPSLPPRRRPLGVWVAAAAVVVGLAAGAVMAGQALVAGARSAAIEAEHVAEPRGGPRLISPGASPLGHVIPPEPESTSQAHEDPGAPSSPAHDDVAAGDASPEDGPDDEPEPTGTEDPSPTASDEASAKSPTASSSRGRSRASKSELERLDAEAQRLWKAGDLAGAEALFLEIVDKGGRSQHAELAFGDLFTLAHQTNNARKEQQRWRRYLARFPHGRFADDVRASQCRRAASNDAAACWRRYLEDWPQGTYRAEANRSSAAAGKGAP